MHNMELGGNVRTTNLHRGGGLMFCIKLIRFAGGVVEGNL